MSDLRVCRACLNQKCKLEPINDTTGHVYRAVTGIDYTPGDGYPSYFCVECDAQIKKILGFRRRCRRAFTALKQIVAVRKKITPIDLFLINRKKTNLISNIGYWENKNVGSYSVDLAGETDGKPSDIRNIPKTDSEAKKESDIKSYDLPYNLTVTKCEPKFINNTHIVTDIQPQNCEDADAKVNQTVKALDANDNDGMIWEAVDCDATDADVTDAEDVNDTDFEDAFKDVPEEKVSEDVDDVGLSELQGDHNYILPESKPEENNESEKKNEDKEYRGMPALQAHKLSRALEDFSIQLLPFDEQVATFQARKETEPYKSAGFKCAMCLIVYPDMSELLNHVQQHTKRQKQLTQAQRKNFQCAICKDSFRCRAELTAHSACYHWYKYTCKKCHAEKYTLFDILKCHYRPSVQITNYSSVGELFKMSDMRPDVVVTKMTNNCRFCGWWFISRRRLSEHEKTHVDAEAPKTPAQRGRYRCDMCGLWCRIKEHLVNHMQLHHRTFTCKECGTVFQGWNAAREHLKEHKKSKCMLCDELFPSVQERRDHQVKHTGKCKIECDLCDFPAYRLGQMYYHQLNIHGYISINRTSAGDPKHLCGMCGVQFDDEAALKAHKVEQGHVKADTLGGKCESCKKMFYTVGEFIAHRRGNTICRKYPVKCAYCDEILRHYYMSKRHYLEMHPNQPNEYQRSIKHVVCELCGKTISRENMSKHMKRHTQAPNEPSLKCKLCRQKMFSSRAFVSHMLFNHTPSPYMCSECPYRNRHRSYCRDHILRVHAPELLYACHKCPRKFSHLDYLASHTLKAHGCSYDRNVYRPLKDVQATVSVFPYMRIDGSLIPPAIIEDAGLYLYDFLCTSRKLVDWKDYYVFNTGVKPIEDRRHYRPQPKRPYTEKRVHRPKKKIDESLIKALEGQNFESEVESEVKEERGTKRTFESDVGPYKVKKAVKKAKLEETAGDWDTLTDVNNVEHEVTVQKYELPDLQADILEEPSKEDQNRSQEKPSKKRQRKPNKPVEEVKVTVKANESQSVNNIKVEDYETKEISFVENVEHEEMVQGYDMPNLQADFLEEPSEAEIIIEDIAKGENVEEECVELDMSQLTSEQYQIIEQNGEQYVVVDGNLYKLQIG